MSGRETSKDVDEGGLRAALTAIAPGTELREGLERILRGETGALIVLGNDRSVEALCTGGFGLDVPFSATGLRELAKMDGAIILDRDSTRILRANVHLVPDPTIATTESGTRHRTAERVAKQTGYPVISVSQSMRTVALYLGERRHVLEDTGRIIARANEALATLERYKARLDEVSRTLSTLEVEDLVTVRDVCSVAQRLEMVRRIASEIDWFVVELGTDGRLLGLQFDELVSGLEAERELVVRDYLPTVHGASASDIDAVLAQLDTTSSQDLFELGTIARILGFAISGDSLDSPVSARGYRLLAKVPRLPATVVEHLVEHFGGLQQLLAASVDDLQAVDGVGDTRARTVREGLSRLAESSILERYV